MQKSIEPVLVRWAVKYDDQFGFPEYAQGTYIGTNENIPFQSGQNIRINDIESIDLFNNILITKDGLKIFLSGSGQRIIMTANNDIIRDFI